MNSNLNDVDTKKILTVSELNRKAKLVMESEIGEIRVEGEISNLVKPASGHIYFTLKDDSAQIRCAWFKGKQKSQKNSFNNGDQIHLSGKVSVFESRGDFQLIVDEIENAGEGELLRQFEILKRKLLEAGLFDTNKKKLLPKMPSTIGIITSPTGAAVQDILTIIERRCPSTSIIIYPTLVQGELAASQIVSAIQIS